MGVDGRRSDVNGLKPGRAASLPGYEVVDGQGHVADPVTLRVASAGEWKSGPPDPTSAAYPAGLLISLPHCVTTGACRLDHRGTALS